MLKFEDFFKTINGAIDNFQAAIPAVQKLIYTRLEPLIKELETKQGKLLNSVKNLKLIGTIKNELQRIIVTPEYKAAVNTFIDSFQEISDLQAQHFSQFVSQYKPAKVLPLIKELAVQATINDLIGQGMKASIMDPITSIITQNITTGGSYADFNEQLRNEILNNGAGEGSMLRYTRQITTDAINQYAAQNADAIAQDLQFNWMQYVGSLITTSREFCIHLTEKRWIHRSELPTIISGLIDGHQCKLSKRTKLPLGMIPDTTPENFNIRRGGYLCGHQAFWVPDSSVPIAVKNKFNNVVTKESALDITKMAQPTVQQMAKDPFTLQALKDLEWGTQYLADPHRYKENTYYRVEGTELNYTGVGQGLYLGRDSRALKRFYDVEDQGLEVSTFVGKPKWLNLMDQKAYKAFEAEAVRIYGASPKNISNHLKELTLAKGYDGIMYYDPQATGQEFVLFNTDKLVKVEAKKPVNSDFFQKSIDAYISENSVAKSELIKITEDEEDVYREQIKNEMKSWTSVEETAINTYTGRGYKGINEWLRNDKPNNTGFYMADVVKDLKLLLKRLPKFNGISYRGMNVSDDQIKNYTDMQIGSILSDKGFLSSSTRPIEVIGMASVLIKKKTAVLMAIRGKNGVYIEPASIAPYEHEVLFAPGTKLKLISKGKLIVRNVQEVIYLELQEVE